MTKRTKKLGKRGLAVLAILIAVTMIASAGLLTYFGQITTTATVSQSVQIDEHNWDEPIAHELEAFGGCCYCFEHEITNNGCEPIILDWETWGTPDLEGIDVTFQRQPYLATLEANVLDGMAEYDDFDVYVDGTLVYSYEAEGGTETWILHEIDLLPFCIPAEGTHTIKFDCTAEEPWEHFETYGQLGVDTVALYCELDLLCDSVDIGCPTSESGHNLIGWGPIEPATSGGNWGGIDNCRATWYPTEPGQQTDESWASVELTCEVPECDCNGVPFMMEPFELQPDETIEFCICYEFDMLIAPGIYEIYTQLIPAII